MWYHARNNCDRYCEPWRAGGRCTSALYLPGPKRGVFNVEADRTTQYNPTAKGWQGYSTTTVSRRIATARTRARPRRVAIALLGRPMAERAAWQPTQRSVRDGEADGRERVREVALRSR
jgi:hypothetical protein